MELKRTKIGRAPSASPTATAIVELLAQKHGRDLFFPEVKDGPTIFGAHLRLDALAIAKSWSPIRMSGYEVKVSRADFLGDRKWEAYLGLVHEFSFAAPKGVLALDELPPGVGLFEVATTGTMLRTIRKPTYREIQVPAELLLYLLMNRVRPFKRGEWGQPTRAERIERWREQLESGRDIAHVVRGRISERMNELRAAARGEKELAELKQWLEARGVRTWGSLVSRVEEAMVAERAKVDGARLELEHAVARAVAELASPRVSAFSTSELVAKPDIAVPASASSSSSERAKPVDAIASRARA